MVVTEFYTQRTDGVKLYRTYSDQGFRIMRDGIVYDEAIDPEQSGRNYIETNEKIPVYENLENEIPNNLNNDNIFVVD